MNLLIERMRKLLGWCPNAKTLETQHIIHSGYFESNSQNRGKDAGIPPAIPFNWWNKRHNRALIISSGLTLFSILWIGSQGVHIIDKTFIAGLILGIIINLLLCIWDWHSLENAKNSTIEIKIHIMSTKMRDVSSVLSLILLYLLLSQFELGAILTFACAFCLIALVYYFKLDFIYSAILPLSLGSTNGFGFIFTFLSGYCLTVFLFYLTSIYWEKKNNKILLVYNHKTPGTYIVNAGEE